MTDTLPYTTRPHADIQKAAQAQWRYTDSGEAEQEGSVAIAYGRSAGLAMMLGDTAKAQAYWDKLLALEPQLPAVKGLTDMPSLAQLFEGAKAANPGSFATFEDGKIFTASPGLGFSNATGALAYAIDFLRRGEEISEAGPKVLEAGTKALRATGYERLAAEWDRLQQGLSAAKNPIPPRG